MGPRGKPVIYGFCNSRFGKLAGKKVLDCEMLTRDILSTTTNILTYKIQQHIKINFDLSISDKNRGISMAFSLPKWNV